MVGGGEVALGRGPCAGVPLKVVLLGSSPLLIQSGLTESLAGRFEVIVAPHWSFNEMREAFGWKLEEYIFYGAYPGAAELIEDTERWRRYILDSLIETTISRDILLLTRVDKPALLRRLFQLVLTCAIKRQYIIWGACHELHLKLPVVRRTGKP